ncbi:MAG: hypothetical protein M1820_009096 [Bogoriella megaspora]|nr:MAG: hypothetical protein M1820_009096 [Bogoriella megaspora]
MDNIPSIGDILMLSQTAWKVGRAFATGRRSSPVEFKEIEQELNALSKALKTFAETLFAEDDNILAQADQRTKNGVATILLSCQQTLQDLESLVEQYQVIRRTETSRGYTVDRSWSELVLTNFGKMMWTTEGGNIQALKTMLHMHTSTISITVQALQENSLARLQNTITPMADKVDDIHRGAEGDLNGKIDDVQQWVMTYANTNPPPPPSIPPSSRGLEDSADGSVYSLSSSSRSDRSRRRGELSPQNERRQYNPHMTPQRTPDLVGSEASSMSSPMRGSNWGSSEASGYNAPDIAESSRGLPASSLGSLRESLREQDEASYFLKTNGVQYVQAREPPARRTTNARSDSARSGTIPSTGSMEVEAIAQPPFFRQVSKDHLRQQRQQQRLPSPAISPDEPLIEQTSALRIDTARASPMNARSSSVANSSSSAGRATPQPYSSRAYSESRSSPQLYPSQSHSGGRVTPQPYSSQPFPDAIHIHDHSRDPIPVTTPPLDMSMISPQRTFRGAKPAESVRSGLSNRSYSTSAPTVTQERPSTPDQREFEDELFRNSAILCDLPAKLVEYTQPSKDESRPWETEMAEATQEARICVVRKRNNVNGVIRFTTSIWAIAYNRSARMEQRLVDGDAIVPYSSFFNPEKVSVSIPTELRFHDAKPSDPNADPRKVSTSWVNYIFHDARAGNIFQSVLFGRKLIAVFRTGKTLRLREGIKGALAYQEQMCGMENMRLWEDEGSAGVLAMMHFSAHFKDGYLSFWLNNSKDPVRVREESSKGIKIKGLDIPVEGTRGVNGLVRKAPGEKGNKKSMGMGLGTGKLGKEGKKLAGKKISGARVEFMSEADKDDFLAFVGRVQDRMVVLPEWDDRSESTRS